MTAAGDEEARRAGRARAVALFRYSLIREAADPGLTTRQRGRLVRELAARPHAGPFGEPVTVSRPSLDRWIRDPPVDRGPRHAHRLAERPRMRPAGQLPYQPAPAAGWTGQRRPPRGSARSGTGPPGARARPAAVLPRLLTQIPPR